MACFVLFSGEGIAFRTGVIDAFVQFSRKWWYLWAYLGLINVVSFIVFCIDKYKAVKGRFRIPEFTLFLLSFLGGAFGGILAMYMVRHKINKQSFAVGLPLIMLAHTVVIVYLIVSFH